MAETSPAFAGFTPAAVQFLADLAEHNERAWFQPRKAEYERLLRQPMEQLCLALAGELAARGLPLQADPKRSPFRIHRDTRFSNDKSPYKTNVAASFPWVEGRSGGTGSGGGAATTGSAAEARELPIGAGERHGVGGYVSLRPGEMYVGGGMYMPAKPRIDAFRRAVVSDPDDVLKALEDPGFVAWFGGAHPHETLKRVPPGYPADHPRADLLRWKDVIFMRRLADEEVFSPDLPARLADGFAAAMPVFRFLATLR
jgi:uncharacterized protein (DUF2461 family)